MDTKVLPIRCQYIRKQNGGVTDEENSIWPIHQRIPGRGRPPVSARVHLGELVRAAKAGKLGEVGKNRKPLTEVEAELARVQREPVITRRERDIVKKSSRVDDRPQIKGR
jgi:hypothetical protein